MRVAATHHPLCAVVLQQPEQTCHMTLHQTHVLYSPDVFVGGDTGTGLGVSGLS